MDLLAQLTELWNHDKHRDLVIPGNNLEALVAAWPELLADHELRFDIGDRSVDADGELELLLVPESDASPARLRLRYGLCINFENGARPAMLRHLRVMAEHVELMADEFAPLLGHPI